MNVKNKLRISVAISVVFTLVIIAGVTFSTVKIDQTITKSFRATEIIKEIFYLSSFTDDYIASPNERVVVQWRVKYNSIGALLSTQKEQVGDDEQEILKRLEKKHRELGSIFPGLTTPLPTQSSEQKLLIRSSAQLKIKSQAMITDASRLNTLSLNSLEAIRNITNIILIILIIISSAITINALLILRAILPPLKDLIDGSDQVARGNFNVNLAVKTDDEFGQVASSFNIMAQKLQKHYQNLEKEIKERTRDMQKFKQAVDSASDHITITDADGTIIYANAAVEHLTGFAPREVLGLKAGSPQLWGGLMPQSFYKRLWRTVKVEKRAFVGQIKNKHKDGKLFYTRANIFPILDAAGEVEFFVEVHRNITREKEVERLKDDFLSLTSHELLTPLTAIDGLASMILDGDYGPVTAQLREPVSDIALSSDRLVHLVADLLNLSRIQSGRLRYSIDVIDLYSIIAQVGALLRPSAKSGGVRLAIPPAGHLSVRADPDKVRQILNNLLGNSLKFTQRGEITVTVKKERNKAVIYIADTGEGIEAQDISKLFNKFQQFATQKASPAGMGLGLYLSRQMARKMGGDVFLVESVPRQGSVFAFSLPLAKS